MMKYFKPPSTSYNSINDVGKFEMLWYVNLLLVPIFFLLSTIMLFSENPSYKAALFAFVISSIHIIILYKLKKFEFIAYTSLFFGSITIQLLIFIVDPTRVIPAVLWTILISFFSFYLLRAWVGIGVILFNILGIFIFISCGDLNTIVQNGINIKDMNFGLLADILIVIGSFILILRKINHTVRDTHLRFEKQLIKNETLMKEIHHRVKNNLQIISSLLKLQANESNSEEVKEHFDAAGGRIQSIALIHQKMYSNDDLSEIELQSYFEALVKDILNTFNRNDVNVEIDTDFKNVNINYFVHFSLILNELITNSLKYCIKKDANLKISIKKEADKLVFLFQDNGTWIHPTNNTSFGLNLLEILTEQLEGTFERESEHSTNYTFIFPSEKFTKQH